MELYFGAFHLDVQPLNHMRDMELRTILYIKGTAPLNHMRDMEQSKKNRVSGLNPLNHMRDMEQNNNTRNERFFNNLN